jgi:hypothetical protein
MAQPQRRCLQSGRCEPFECGPIDVPQGRGYQAVTLYRIGRSSATASPPVAPLVHQLRAEQHKQFMFDHVRSERAFAGGMQRGRGDLGLSAVNKTALRCQRLAW